MPAAVLAGKAYCKRPLQALTAAAPTAVPSVVPSGMTTLQLNPSSGRLPAESLRPCELAVTLSVGYRSAGLVQEMASQPALICHQSTGSCSYPGSAIADRIQILYYVGRLKTCSEACYVLDLSAITKRYQAVVVLPSNSSSAKLCNTIVRYPMLCQVTHEPYQVCHQHIQVSVCQ